MKKIHRTFITQLCTALDEHLQEAERGREAVSILASGAAFESWLAFETRLLLEHRNDILPTDRHAIENERGKSDVFISAWSSGRESCHALLEFKLIYNNKNWKNQVEAVRTDLYPSRPSKKRLKPAVPRIALVGFVGKMYRPGARYAGPIKDLAQWEKEALASLTKGKRSARCVWKGARMPVKHEFLRPEFENFVQLRAFVPANTNT